MDPLTPRERRFVEEYLIDLNATRAARRAGYSPATCRGAAFKIRHRPRVAAAIAEGIEARSRVARISAESVVSALARVGFADVRRLFDDAGEALSPADLDADIAAAVDISIRPSRNGKGKPVTQVSLRASDRRRALVDLARHLGLFKPRGEGAGPRNMMGPASSAQDGPGTIELAAKISAILEAARRRNAAMEGE